MVEKYYVQKPRTILVNWAIFHICDLIASKWLRYAFCIVMVHNFNNLHTHRKIILSTKLWTTLKVEITKKKKMHNILRLEVLERIFTLRDVRRVMKPVGMKTIPITKKVPITCKYPNIVIWHITEEIITIVSVTHPCWGEDRFTCWKTLLCKLIYSCQKKKNSQKET